MRLSHNPLTNPDPKTGMETPRMIRTPPAIMAQPITRPTMEANRVAVSRLPVSAQTMDRSTLPPSRGKPGTMLKTPRTTLIEPSQTSSVVSGLS